MDRVPDRKTALRRAVIALATLSATTAYAEHDHHHHGDEEHREAEASDVRIVASVGAIAARYRSLFYEGSYQGAVAGGSVGKDRFELGLQVSAYQIDRNGKMYRGAGDAMVHGAVTLFARDQLAAGAHLMVMIPVGDDNAGLGMGHWMLMPAAWAAWSPKHVTLSAAVGYARGIGDESAHAEHGGGAAWPLVDPMSFSEVTYDASAMFGLARELRAGVRVLGAIPLDDDARAIGAARVGLSIGRVETSAEAQAGLAGDPFRFRAVVGAAMRF
jgi:hypothetical protein